MILFRVLRKIYRDLVVKEKHHISFWILLTFLPTFIAARALVYLYPDIFINIRGTHIHHLTYGIFILAISGYLSLTAPSVRLRPPIAALFGIGLALSFDEFGMWLHLKDNYWMRQSYDAMLIIMAILINIVYFGRAWNRIFYYFLRLILGRRFSTT